jgi:hypothetical protein
MKLDEKELWGLKKIGEGIGLRLRTWDSEMRDVFEWLEDDGYINIKDGRMSLTPKGKRAVKNASSQEKRIAAGRLLRMARMLVAAKDWTKALVNLVGDNVDNEEMKWWLVDEGYIPHEIDEWTDDVLWDTFMMELMDSRDQSLLKRVIKNQTKQTKGKLLAEIFKERRMHDQVRLVPALLSEMPERNFDRQILMYGTYTEPKRQRGQLDFN